MIPQTATDKPSTCGARTRAGSLCRIAAVLGKTRCRMHDDSNTLILVC
ncbi:MAG: HGGxSTG domain-containing protein [Rhodospirillaceae bacterium]